MTVVRGDQARSLMARTGSLRRQQRRSDGVSSWSHSIDIGELDDVGAVVGGAAALLRQRLTGTSLARRHDDVVTVMTELVNDAHAVSGHVILRLLWTPPDCVLVEVTDRAPAAGPDLATLPGSAVVDRLADSLGPRATSAGTCVWARLSAQPAC